MSGYAEKLANLQTHGGGAVVLNPRNPMHSARAFVDRHYTHDQWRTLHHWNSDFYRWTGTAYAPLDDDAARAALYRFLEAAQSQTADGKPTPFQPTTTKVNMVLDALRAVTNLPTTVTPPCWLQGKNEPGPARLICLKNGLLDLESRQLMACSPDFFTLNALDFAYDAAAGDPKQWLTFLDQLWEDDQESQDTLQELFGYALTCDTSQQKLFMMEGPKRSGKGTTARVLTAMIGRDNVRAPTLTSLGKDFGVQPLIGKQLAIISDARLSLRAEVHNIAERLLTISGEDTVTVDRKHREAWTGRLGTRFIIFTNELPILADASGTLISRFILLRLTESFYGREDLGLTDRLLTELPSILNWALDGWQRLQERGHFKQPKSSQGALQELEDLASPVKAFVRDCCDVGSDREILKNALYQTYKGWCDDGGLRPKSLSIFSRDLLSAFRTIKSAKRLDAATGKRPGYFEGVDLIK